MHENILKVNALKYDLNNMNYGYIPYRKNHTAQKVGPNNTCVIPREKACSTRVIPRLVA